MSGQTHRLPQGGLIDRGQPLRFSFDGREFGGYEGDSLASALLANGVRLVARSFKYHRPRGIFSAGAEEPNALVQLGREARLDANVRATTAELFDGLEAHSQNRWPSLRFDITEVNNLLSAFLPAGFYYKTFMWPASYWLKYEAVIRRAAGLGRLNRGPDPDRYDHVHEHCDLLVVGGGASGLLAAASAASTGARVILVDEGRRLGGRLLDEKLQLDDRPALGWVDAMATQLAGYDNLRILTRTVATAYYDDNLVACLEHVQDHLAQPEPFLPRQRLWHIRAGQVILASGAIEQSIAFPDNDRPGVMLAGAVRTYINRYGVLPGKRAVVLTNNDDAYRTAWDLQAAGCEVVGIVDLRAKASASVARQALDLGIPVLQNHLIEKVHGRLAVRAVTARAMARGRGNAGGGARHRMDCDLLCIGGGWAPALHLYSQSGGKLDYDAALGAHLPGKTKQAVICAGSANGRFDLAACLADGLDAGVRAAAAAGFKGGPPPALPETGKSQSLTGEPIRQIPGLAGKCFVDLQGDVTTADMALAVREGYDSPELAKRYTTAGMGVDQGKTSNLMALQSLAQAQGEILGGLRDGGQPATTFRPPYQPIAIGALAGRDIGLHFAPLRRTPMDSWHVAQGAAFTDAGLWRRAHYYPRQKSGGHETVDQASCREAKATRDGAGLCDVTTLGKIDLQGPDVAELLNRVYTNGWKTLAVGKARYGLMLREDGLTYDDGTTSRLAKNHYVMTTTTANAVRVMAELEFYLQAVWPELRVLATSVTEQWAAMSIAGPKARELLAPLIDIDISNQAFPFMGAAFCRLGDIPARLFRISFSGELAFEINVPSDYGLTAWQTIVNAGKDNKDSGLVVYGTETLGTLRIEKGHVAGPEIDGRTTAGDLGLGRMMSSKKAFIGSALANREGLRDENRPALVGLTPVDGESWIKAGAHLLDHAIAVPPENSLGHVTSIAFSPALGMPVALALVSGGLSREGETLYAHFPLKDEVLAVKVTSPHFFDPEGERMYV